MLNYDCIHNFVNPIPDLHAVLQRLLEGDPGQYLISDVQWLGALPMALGAPGLGPRRWVSVSAIPFFLSSDDTTFFGPVPTGPARTAGPPTGPRTPSSPWRCSRPGTVSPKSWSSSAQRRTAQRVHGRHLHRAGRGSALTAPGFEFEWSDAPVSLHLVGILAALGGAGRQPPRWWDDLDGPRPVAVVTQGTIATGTFPSSSNPPWREWPAWTSPWSPPWAVRSAPRPAR